jgi:hypoxia up-regulated 1
MKLCLLVALVSVVYANVIGIDFGSEFIKMSLIGPGKKLLIVENDHAKRKTPAAVFFS